MKISNASKKVLASALSAAMVVAFAPTVAFGAQAGNELKISYDLAGGYDNAANNQDKVEGGVVKAEADAAVASDVSSYYTIAADDAGKLVASQASGKAQPKVTYYEKNAAPAGGFDVPVDAYYGDATDLTKVSGAAHHVDENAEYYVAKDGLVAEGDTVANTAVLKLASGANIVLPSGDDPSTAAVEGYEFDAWKVFVDANGNGTKDADEKDVAVTDNVANVFDSSIVAGASLVAKATYKTQTIADNTDVTVNADKLTFKAAVADASKALKGTGKFVVTAPDGTTKVQKNANGATQVTLDEIAAQAGTYTVELVDGNGVTVDTQEAYVGSFTLAGGAINIDSSTDYLPTQTYYYVADGSKTYKQIIGATSDVKVYKLKADGSVDTSAEGKFYDEKGSEIDFTAKPATGKKNAVASTFNAAFEASLVAMTADKRTVKATAAGVSSWATAAEYKTPAAVADTKYYMVITDAAGKVVAKTPDTGAAATLSYANADNGTYTVTLYKVGGYKAATATVAAVEGKTEAIDSKTVTVDAVAAAPSFAYAATYKANGDVDYGTLTLTNNAGEGFKVMYKIGSGAAKAYDTAKGGVKLSASDLAKDITVWATNGKTDPKDLVESNVVALVSSDANAKAFADIVANATVGKKATVYYKNDADVKAAQKAAQKSFTDTGYKAQVKAENGTDITWFDTSVAAYKTVLDAVAKAAKAELATLAAGTADSKGSVTVITSADLAAANAAVDAAVAAFVANNDGTALNDVKTVNGQSVDGAAVAVAGGFTNGANYVTAINNAVKNAKTTVVAKADVEAASAVNAAIAALPAEVTASNAKDAKAAAEKVIADYATLSADAKALVSSADYDKAVQTIKAADAAVKDADKAAVAKVKGKTVKAKAAKKTTAKLKVVTSKSGAKSTFKKVKGDKKVTVSKSGKIVVEKGLKAGKKYTVKVKATVGTQTKTVKVIVKVAK